MTNILAKRYAQAFFEHCVERLSVESGYQDFLKVSRIISESEEFAQFLRNPTIPAEKIRQILYQLLNDHLNAATYQFISFLASKKRLNLLPAVCDAFEKLYKESKNILEVTIKSSVPITKNQIDSIGRHLKEKFHKDIEPRVIIDSKIVGGFMIQVGDIVHDYSMRTQLEQFRDRLIFNYSATQN